MKSVTRATDGFKAGIRRVVVPAKAGIHAERAALGSMLSIGSGLRRNDGFGGGGLKSDGFNAGILKADGFKAAILKTVIPAQAGTHAERAARGSMLSIGSRLRGNDGFEVTREAMR